MAQIFLPNEFLQGDKIFVETISNIYKKSLDAPAFSLPRHSPGYPIPAVLLAVPYWFLS
jgi:hypothetical protein